MTLSPVTAVETEDELRELRAAVRGHLARHVAPLVAEHERARTFPWEILPPLHELGYVRGLVGPEDGGDGISFTALAILMEEAGRCWGSLRTTLNVLTIVPYVLSQVASPAQKEAFLSRLLTGESRAWIGITESEAGSDAGAMRTFARRVDGGYVVDGRKLYITNGATNDIGLLLASTDRTLGTKGITAFLVDRAVSPYDAIPMEHMSVRATNNCELVFDEVFVPEANRVGDEGRGLGVAMRAINIGRLNMAMGAVGIADAALEIAIAHVRERRQFGRPLAGFQLVQKLIVDAATELEAARLLGMRAAATLDAGLPARKECSMAKYYCSEVAMRAVTNAMQTCGGAGLMEEMQVERMFRDVREASIPEGTSELQILTIGKALLGVSALS
jgi:acyl-CoA dehydrogenase